MVALAHPEIGAGDDGTLIPAGIISQYLVPAGIVGKDQSAVGVGNGNGIGAVAEVGELQIHGDLFRITLGPVHGGAQGHHGAAVDVGTQVGIQARVGGGIGGSHHGTAVDDQVAIGVDAVALFAKARDDMEGTCVDGGDGNTVLIGVDAVVAGADVDIAAVDGEMQLGIQALIFGGEIQSAGAVDVQGHIGIQGAVLLPQLFLTFFVLVDLRHIGTADGVFALQDQVGTGGGGVHRGGGGVHGPVPVAFVDVQKQDGGGHGAGDVRIVQDQFHHGILVVTGIFPQVDADLSGGELAGNPVSAGEGDVHHGVGGGLVGAVLVGIGALAVGVAAVVGIPVLVVDNVVGDVHPSVSGIRRVYGQVTYGDAVVGQGNDGLGVKTGHIGDLRVHRVGDGGVSRAAAFGGIRCWIGAAAAEQGEDQQDREPFFHNWYVLPLG